MLGGKSFGKSFVKAKAVAKVRETYKNVEVIDVDMRDRSLKRKPSLVRSVEEEQRGASVSASLGFLMPSFMGVVVNEALKVVGDAAAEFAAKQTTSALQKVVDKTTDEDLDALLTQITAKGKFPALVIDEANLGLPASGMGKEEAKRVLALGCPNVGSKPEAPSREKGNHRHFLAQLPL